MVPWKYTCRKCPDDPDEDQRRTLCRKNRKIKSTDGAVFSVPCGATRKQRSDIGQKRESYRGNARRRGEKGKVRAHKYRTNMSSLLTPYWWNQHEGWAVNVFRIKGKSDFHKEYNELTTMKDRFDLFKEVYKKKCSANRPHPILAKALYMVFNLYHREKFGLQGPKQQRPQAAIEDEAIVDHVPVLGVRDRPDITLKFTTFIHQLAPSCSTADIPLANLTNYKNDEVTLLKNFKDNIDMIHSWPEHTDKDKVLKLKAMYAHYLHYLKFIHAKSADEINYECIRDLIKLFNAPAGRHFISYLNTKFKTNLPQSNTNENKKTILSECYRIMRKYLSFEFFEKVGHPTDYGDARTASYHEDMESIDAAERQKRTHRDTVKSKGRPRKISDIDDELLRSEEEENDKHEEHVQNMQWYHSQPGHRDTPYRINKHETNDEQKGEEPEETIQRAAPYFTPERDNRHKILYKLIRRRQAVTQNLAKRQTEYANLLATHGIDYGTPKRRREKYNQTLRRRNAMITKTNVEVSQLTQLFGVNNWSDPLHIDVLAKRILKTKNANLDPLAEAINTSLETYKAKLDELAPAAPAAHAAHAVGRAPPHQANHDGDSTESEDIGEDFEFLTPSTRMG